MAKKDYFDFINREMRYAHLWLDSPVTIRGKLLAAYAIFRILVKIALIVSAATQVQVYGMAYLVDGSMIFVPMGTLAIVVNGWSMIKHKEMTETCLQLQNLLDSFEEEWEREIVDKVMSANERTAKTMSILLSAYVHGTCLLHVVTISCKYFFGFPQKAVLLPILYEKYLEDNYELHAFLVFSTALTCLYIEYLNSFRAFVTLELYVMKGTVTTLMVLSTRMKRATKEAEGGVGLLETHLNLRDSVEKHATLINIFEDMTEWNGFPLVHILTVCTGLFCINGVIIKQSLETGEASALSIWGSFLVFTLATAYIFCSYAQEIEIKCEQFSVDIYDLPWYRECPNRRRDVLTMLVEANRYLTVHYRGVTSVNLDTYLETIRKAYSFFTLVSTTE